MSATFKNAKKKLSQTELRKYMHEHRTKQREIKKIDSPLAKYNEQGQLICVLCKSVVRSEAVWTVHVNAKLHKQNVDLAKNLKERTNNFTTPLKRTLTSPIINEPEKKIKSILKNANGHRSDSESSNDPSNINTTLHENVMDSRNNQDMTIFLKSHPADEIKEKMGTECLQDTNDILPEGFFDDPKLDAKARNQEYKDPIEEEWEKFVKAIKEADNESNAIIAEDQEEATIERQIDEIDEQMTRLSRVLDLERKKEHIVAVSAEPKNTRDNYDDDIDIEENEFDEFLDWRAKKSFK